MHFKALGIKFDHFVGFGLMGFWVPKEAEIQAVFEQFQVLENNALKFLQREIVGSAFDRILVN
jgi:hypothetical protein